jgi:hypothetical protein
MATRQRERGRREPYATRYRNDVGERSIQTIRVQAMAGFGGGGAAASLNPIAPGADTSQQSLLTAPQHA